MEGSKDMKAQPELLQQKFDIRLLGSGDNFSDLTSLLHRAYAPLAAQGMRFLASHQDEATTLSRILKGECWVAIAEGRIVGTIVLKDAQQTRGSPWYDRPEVACFGQFAVEPACQRHGLGSKLLEWIETRAREKGIVELALDTAEGAADLIRFYTRRGYRFIEYTRWDIVNYQSVILSKTLSDAP